MFSKTQNSKVFKGKSTGTRRVYLNAYGLRIAQSRIPGAGNGVFATERICKGGLILYRGERLEKQAAKELKNQDYVLSGFGEAIDGSACAQPPFLPNLAVGALVNHSSEKPNVIKKALVKKGGLQYEYFLVATREIAAGEEVLFNYDSSYWQKKGKPPEKKTMMTKQQQTEGEEEHAVAEAKVA